MVHSIILISQVNMGEKGCCCRNYTKGLLIGASVAIIVWVIVYFTHTPPNFDVAYEHIKKLLPQGKSNQNQSSMAIPVLPEHPKDVRRRTSQSEIDELLQSVEFYKESLPKSIVNTVTNLIADVQNGTSATPIV